MTYGRVRCVPHELNLAGAAVSHWPNW